jgi:hypothetical protein
MSHHKLDHPSCQRVSCSKKNLTNVVYATPLPSTLPQFAASDRYPPCALLSGSASTFSAQRPLEFRAAILTTPKRPDISSKTYHNISKQCLPGGLRGKNTAASTSSAQNSSDGKQPNSWRYKSTASLCCQTPSHARQPSACLQAARNTSSAGGSSLHFTEI